MKSLFLLLTCIVCLLFIKQLPKEQLEQRIIENEQVNFSGRLYLPKTIRLGDKKVKGKITVYVKGAQYEYLNRWGEYYLDGEPEELDLLVGDEVKASVPVKLWFAREV